MQGKEEVIRVDWQKKDLYFFQEKDRYFLKKKTSIFSSHIMINLDFSESNVTYINNKKCL